MIEVITSMPFWVGALVAAVMVLGCTVLSLLLTVRTLSERIDLLIGMMEPPKQHMSIGTPFCGDCGIHVSEWEIKSCRARGNLRILHPERLENE